MSSREPRCAHDSSAKTAYLVAGLAVAAAVLIRWALAPVLGSDVPFITVFLAVVIAAWYGGTRPALAATAASCLLAWYFFVPRQYSLVIEDSSGANALILFVVVACAISIFGGRMKNAERLAHQHEALHRVTIASIGDAVITTDGGGRVTGMNPIAAGLCGWSPNEALGQPLEEVLQLVNEDTRRPAEHPVRKVIAHGHSVGLANHTILIARDGSERPIDDSAAPIRDDEGQVVGVVMVFRDISERRSAEVALERLAAIVESSEDAIIGKDLDGIVTTWNRGAEQIFGYAPDEIIGRSITALIPPERVDEEDAILARLREGEKLQHYETVRLTKDGRRIDVSLSISPLRNAEGELIGASKIARDVTSRKEAEIARRESQDRFAAFLQALPGLAWIKDLQGRYVLVNEAAEQAFGRPREKLYGMTDDELFDRLTADQFKANDQSALATEHGIEVIESLVHEDGVHYSIVSKFPIPGPNGEPAFVGEVAIDITDQMRAEESLREADRKKDEFLATLAHELRNPLAPIRNATKILQGISEHDATARAAVEMLDRQTRQMVRLIDDLLDISRITRGKIELQRERIELGTVVAQVLEAARADCERMGHSLSVQLSSDPVYLDADSTRIAQIVSNLLNNACKFTPPGGAIRLGVERDRHEAVIRIEDNGIGIHADKLACIFDIFSQVDTSLERSREGLGIGLSLVKNLVGLHGGSVEARSGGIGRGSEFIVRLPIGEAQPASEIRPAAEESSTEMTLRVLVVDDNVDAATSLALLLKLQGHTIELAHDGLQAVEATRAFQPDVVLLDIGLPGLNGYDAGRLIRESNPDRRIRLVALTGWGQPDDRQRSKDAGFDAHLVKPVDLPALSKVLSGSLDSGPYS